MLLLLLLFSLFHRWLKKLCSGMVEKRRASSRVNCFANLSASKSSKVALVRVETGDKYSVSAFAEEKEEKEEEAVAMEWEEADDFSFASVDCDFSMCL